MLSLKGLKQSFPYVVIFVALTATLFSFNSKAINSVGTVARFQFLIGIRFSFNCGNSKALIYLVFKVRLRGTEEIVE